MIFITVGTQKFQFDRLLKIVDDLIGEKLISDNVEAQVGHSRYIPKNFNSFQFKSENEINLLIENADIIITHSGIGSITTALKLQKKVIVVPRLKEYKEHVDDHQLEIANVYKEKGYIAVANNKSELVHILKNIDSIDFKLFKTGNSSIISSINKYIASM